MKENQMTSKLSEFTLFSELSLERVEQVLKFASTQVHPKNSFIFKENDQCDGMYILVKGLVKICHTTQDGKEVVLHLIREGSVFGESAVFQSAVFPASAFSLQESTVLYFSRKNLEESLLLYSDWSLELLKQLSLRLRMFVRKLEARGGKDIVQRLAAYIIHRSRLDNRSIIVKLGVSQEVLGGILGTTRESISRAMGKLVDTQCIQIKGKEIHILDYPKLEEIGC